jgi:integrase
LLDNGTDPLAAKRQRITAERIAAAKTVTFGECANAYIDAHAASWKNDKHAAQWYATFNGSKRGSKLIAAATAAINHLPVSIIDTALALKVLEPIWTKTTETASRVRQRCEQVIAWATVRQYREGANPFAWRGHLDKLLPKPSVLKKRKHEQNGGAHHPSLPYADMPAFMAELRGNRFVSARALEFTILTATRTNEVINATWNEVDFANKTWTIPAARMKAGKEHRVPLSDRAVHILSELPREDDNPHIFIGAKSKQPLSNLAMLELMKVLRPEYVPHGFRSTFRTWAAETTAFPHDVCEQALAHTIRNAVERAYQHSDLFDKRRKLMTAWAEYCTAPVAATTAKVTPLRRKAKAS